jgi:hypothetical protein
MLFYPLNSFFNYIYFFSTHFVKIPIELELGILVILFSKHIRAFELSIITFLYDFLITIFTGMDVLMAPKEILALHV